MDFIKHTDSVLCYYFKYSYITKHLLFRYKVSSVLKGFCTDKLYRFDPRVSQKATREVRVNKSIDFK